MITHLYHDYAESLSTCNRRSTRVVKIVDYKIKTNKFYRSKCPCGTQSVITGSPVASAVTFYGHNQYRIDRVTVHIGYRRSDDFGLCASFVNNNNSGFLFVPNDCKTLIFRAFIHFVVSLHDALILLDSNYIRYNWIYITIR